MKSQRVMFFGAPGQIGQAFQYVWKSLPQRPLWELGLFGRQECDIGNPVELKTVMQNFRPDLVINAAGLTRVDVAEQDEKTATEVNFHAVAGMAAQCSALDVPLIHLSTDYVFDGQKTTPYLPDDPMNPINTYGASKMMGEEALRHELAWHVILRVSSVFSAFHRNILTNTIQLIDKNDALRMVADTLSAPTPATHIVRALISMGQQILGGKTDGFGTFQLCGTPPCSRLEWAQAVLKAYEPYTTRRPTIEPTTSAAFAAPAQRPAYTVMDCAKIKEIYGVEQRPWQEGLDEAMEILFSRNGRTRL